MAEAAGAARRQPAVDARRAARAFEVTGYERGTITPFGARTAWPVIADERLLGRRVTLGAGAHGVAVAVDADAAVAALKAQVADVTDAE